MNTLVNIIGVIVIITLLFLVFAPAIMLEWKLFIFLGISLKWLILQYVALIIIIIFKLGTK